MLVMIMKMLQALEHAVGERESWSLLHPLPIASPIAVEPRRLCYLLRISSNNGPFAAYIHCHYIVLFLGGGIARCHPPILLTPRKARRTGTR